MLRRGRLGLLGRRFRFEDEVFSIVAFANQTLTRFGEVVVRVDVVLFVVASRILAYSIPPYLQFQGLFIQASIICSNSLEA